MIDVSFADSECGLIRLSLRKSASGATFPYRNMDLGKISEDDFILGRRKWTDNLFYNCSKKEKQGIYKEDDERFQNIIDAAKRGETLRIWYSDCAFSKCGFYHLVYSLRDTAATILTVKFPESALNGENKERMSWGHLTPEDVDNFVVLQKPLEENEKKEIINKWERLIEDNAELRISVDGEIVSVSEDYFDDKIMRYAPNGEFKVVSLVGFILGNSNCFTSISLQSLFIILVKSFKL